MWSEPVDDWTSGIYESKQLCDLVECFAGGVVASVADVFVGPRIAFLRREVEMRMSAGDDQCEHRKLQIVVALLPLLEQHGVNVALEMVDGNQRLVERESQRLGIADAYQQGSSEARALSHRDSVNGFVGVLRLGKRLAHDGHDGAQMLP